MKEKYIVYGVCKPESRFGGDLVRVTKELDTMEQAQEAAEDILRGSTRYTSTAIMGLYAIVTAKTPTIVYDTELFVEDNV